MERQVSLLESPRKETVIPACVTDLLPPPNPIITKPLQLEEKVVLRIDPLAPPSRRSRTHHTPPSDQHPTQQQGRKSAEEGRSDADKRKEVKWKPYMEVMTLANGYQADTLIFRRYGKDAINRRGKREYFSSVFVGIQGNRAMRLPEYRGMLRDDDLIFDSSFQSANLMAVFKIEDRVYDLVLQNDLNTRGFTQWYNFKVTNRRNNFVVKFNIVNLYKSKSLYNIGMKPIVRSEKSDKGVKKTWRRRGFKIYYDKYIISNCRNQLSYEDNLQKCYKTLSFEYDFTIENDTVQFAHGMPYDLSDLKRLLAQAKNSQKVKISSIGNTLMGHPIPMVKIAGTEERGMEKKAIVILGRQHPGETPGSFVAQEIMLELLRNSTEVDFLLWRFDIFLIPMVNQDGVQLGNYRSNFAGFDLNRCWLRPDPVRHPEVVAIKNTIRKLQRKYKIELVLDLHGHSRKMGSFFYGNNYGNNHLLFPYIASKLSRNILFEKSRFSRETETDLKGSTARAVLGQMLRDSAHVYTYEVSFFGNYREDHSPFSFTQESYREMAHALLQAVYKTYLELYKEQKTLKQSHFLKTTKNELTDIAVARKIDDEEESGSDSEAEEQVEEERKEIEQFLDGLDVPDLPEDLTPPPVQIVKRPSVWEGVDREISISKRVKELRDLGEPVERHTEEVKQKIQELLDKNINEDLREVILQRLPSIRKDSIRSPIINSQHTSQQLIHLIGPDTPPVEPESAQITKGKKYGLPQYFRVKKYKNYVDWLKVSGETFALHEREKQKDGQMMSESRKHSNQKAESNIHKIKQNMLLISHGSKSTDDKPKGNQLTSIMVDSRQLNEKEERKQQHLHEQKSKPTPILKEFPSASFDEVHVMPVRVNRADYHREQNRTKRITATPKKDNRQGKYTKQGIDKHQGRSRLPPI